MAQVSTACSITFFTHVEYTLLLSARGRLRLVRREGAGSRTCLYHICMVLQPPARNHRQQRACPLDSKTLRQPQAFLFQPLPLSLFNRLCCALVTGAPEIRERAFDILFSDRRRREPFQISSTSPNPSHPPCSFANQPFFAISDFNVFNFTRSSPMDMDSALIIKSSA